MKKKYKLFWSIIKYRLENFFEKNSLVYALSIARNLKMEEQITIDSINEIFPTICFVGSNPTLSAIKYCLILKPNLNLF